MKIEGFTPSDEFLFAGRLSPVGIRRTFLAWSQTMRLDLLSNPKAMEFTPIAEAPPIKAKQKFHSMLMNLQHIRFSFGIVPPVIIDVLTQWGGFAILIENDKTTIMTRGKIYNLE